MATAVGGTVAAKGGHQAGHEAGHERFEGWETGADDARVAFNGGP